MDLASLDTSFQQYLHDGLAPLTHKSYDAGLRRFSRICVHYDVFSPFPVTEKLLCYFATAMANDGLAPQTIKSYLSAVRSMQLSLGLPPPRDQSSLPVVKASHRWHVRRHRAMGGKPPSSEIQMPTNYGNSASPNTEPTGHSGPHGQYCILGNSYIRVLRLLPSRRAVGRNRDCIRASPAPQLGEHRYQRSLGRNNGEVPPSEIQMRPVWHRHRRTRRPLGLPAVPRGGHEGKR